MKIRQLLPVVFLAAAGCSSPKAQTQKTPAHPQVEFDSSQPQYIYINREVRNRGKYAWTNGMTLQNAIDGAGGFTDFAGRYVRITHSNGSTDKVAIDSNQHLATNLSLQPNDSIWVSAVLW